MRILKVTFLILVLAQLTLSICCFVSGVWWFMENIALAIQLGFVILGLAVGLSGIKLAHPKNSKGKIIAGWILIALSSGFAIFMSIQNIRLILDPPHYPFG